MTKIQEEDYFRTGGWKICSLAAGWCDTHVHIHGESYQLQQRHVMR